MLHYDIGMGLSLLIQKGFNFVYVTKEITIVLKLEGHLLSDLVGYGVGYKWLFMCFYSILGDNDV